MTGSYTLSLLCDAEGCCQPAVLLTKRDAPVVCYGHGLGVLEDDVHRGRTPSRGLYEPESVRSRRALTSRRLWAVAIVFWLIGDLVTTVVGLRAGAVETNPFMQQLIAGHGFAAMVGMKGIVLAGAIAGYRLLSDPHRIGIPLGLASLGVVVTLWNCVVIALVA